MNKTYLIAFLDLLCCFVMVLLLMFNPVKDPENVLDPPGNLFVYTTWIDNGHKLDVDTWMLAPKMQKPIGYDNKESPICNLVKDDLGVPGTVGEGNYENILCRNTPDGEYIINLYAYHIEDVPLPVHVQISMMINGKIQVLFEDNIELSANHDEKTVVRFKIKNGQVVSGSINHQFISLWGMGKNV